MEHFTNYNFKYGSNLRDFSFLDNFRIFYIGICPNFFCSNFKKKHIFMNFSKLFDIFPFFLIF